MQSCLLMKNAECAGRDLNNSDIWQSDSFDKGEQFGRSVSEWIILPIRFIP